MKNTLLYSLLAVSIGTISIASLAWADEIIVDKVSNQTNTIVITATRTEKGLEGSLASTTVVTKEDIARLQANDVYQILEAVPGINLHRTGGYGSTMSVSLRGTATSRTLFLIDGQRMSSATLGEPNLAYLNPNQIERIEIVRGPRASLYGADALGGVIQIFTKQASDKTQVTLSAGMGADAFGGDKNYLLQQHYAGISGSLSPSTKATFGVSYEGTGGIDGTQDKSMANDDNDAYRNTGINFSLTQEFSVGEIRFNYLKNEIHSEYDNAGGCTNVFFASLTCQGFNDSEVESYSLNGIFSVTDFWDITANIGYFSEKNKNGDDLSNDPSQVFQIDNLFITERYSALLQNDFLLGENHLFSIGADWYEDNIDGYVYTNTGFGAPLSKANYLDENGEKVDSRDNLAFFVQYQATFGRVDLLLGAREDDNEKYDTNTTANIALGVSLNDEFRVAISWGEAFVAPTFNDLYWPTGANPFLEPEKSDTYEASLNGTHERFNWQLAYYQTKIDDMIEWAPTAVPFIWAPSNIEKAKINGVEIIVSSQIAEWLVSGSFAYLDAEYKETVGSTNNDNKLVARPDQTVKFDADRRFGNINFGMSLLIESERMQDKANIQESAGYGLFNLRTAYNFNKELKVQFKVDNVFDKEYVTRSYSFGFPSSWEDYNNFGRSAFVSVVYTPEW